MNDRKQNVKQEQLLWLLFLTLTHFFGTSCSKESARRKIALQPSIMKISINRKISFNHVHVRIMMSCHINKYTASAQNVLVYSLTSRLRSVMKNLLNIGSRPERGSRAPHFSMILYVTGKYLSTKYEYVLHHE